MSSVLRRTVLTSLLAAALAVGMAWAEEPAAQVSNAWIREPPPGLDTAAVYFTVQNTTKNPIVIVGVKSPIAAHAMMHETSTVEGQSRMRMRDKVTVPAQGHVSFAPEGLHVMLTGLTKTLAVGEKVPLMLERDQGSPLNVVAVVRPLDAK